MRFSTGIKKITGLKEVALGISILFSGYNVFSQTVYVDSLQALLAAHLQNDTVKVNLLNDLAWELRGDKFRQSDSLSDLALYLSNQVNYIRGKGIALAIKGYNHRIIADRQSARKAFQESRQFLDNAGDKGGLAFLLRMWGNLDLDEGNYAESLNKFMLGLKLAQEVRDIKSVVEIERTIGYLYAVLGEYEKAISYGNKALEQARSIGYKAGISRAYNALGETFINQGDYTASLEAFTNALVIDQELKDSMNTAISFGNVADAHERIGNYHQALFYVRLALNYFNAKEFPRERVFNEWVLGRALLHTNNPDSGLYYGEHSLMLANKIGYRLFLPQILQLIAESSAKLKMYDTAYKYQLLSSAFKDSLTGQQTTRKTTMLQAQIELDKKQAQIALLIKDQQLKIVESKRQRLSLYAVLGGLVFVTVFALALYRNNRLKQRANLLLKKQKKEIDDQKRKVEQALEELRSTQSQLIQSEKEKILAHHHKELLTLEAKALRAQMNPHFIYNCLNSVKALMQQQETERGITYLTTFSKLIRTLFHNSDKRQVSLYDEIETCGLYTQLESMRLNGKLQYAFCIDPNLDLKSVMVPALIIQPFIENAIWHGIVPKDGGAVNISVKGNDEVIICEVDDDGIGREMSKLNKPVTPIVHESKGVYLSQQRLNLEKMLNDTNASIEIIDKYEDKTPIGTKVILSFNLN